jgi:hypothetical protein
MFMFRNEEKEIYKNKNDMKPFENKVSFTLLTTHGDELK